MTRRLWARRYAAWLVLPLIVVGAVAAWLAFDPGFRREHQIASLSIDAPKDEFERRVRDYLMANPDVIMQSVNQLEARQRTKDQTEVQAIVKSRAEEIFSDAEAPTGGNPNGDVTLVEFFDYNCSYCRQVAPVVSKAEEGDPLLRIAYKEFPILGPNSTFAAKAALAANKQGKYLAFHKALYEVHGTVDPGKVREVAIAVGLDMNRLKADMADPSIQAAITRNLALAQALRINGTPGFVIGNQILRGATDLETLQGMISTARERRE
ncbi:MAG: DsbA family protein [Pseudomonadota bacterium]